MTTYHVPVAYIESDGKLLLVHENDGYWSFCGGAFEESDKSLEDSLARELLEELPLKPENFQIHEKLIEHEFMYDNPQSKRFGNKGIMHVFRVNLLSDEIRSTNDVGDFSWLTKQEALEKISGQEKPILEKLLH